MLIGTKSAIVWKKKLESKPIYNKKKKKFKIQNEILR